MIDAKTAKRFWSKVSKSGCWIWKGSKDRKGYGRITVKLNGMTKHTTMLVHRLSMMLYLGRILPSDVKVLHNCPERDNPSCVNPDHLWLGTIADNNRDMVKKGTHKAPCLKGEACGASKLTAEKVRYIRRQCLELGRAGLAVGKELGLHHSTVYDILSGATWKHVT